MVLPALILSLLFIESVTSLDVSGHQLRYESPQKYNAANCTNVRIPPQLCSKCRLRPHDSFGNFNRTYNKDIIDFETPECLLQLEEYVRLNPCDTLRKEYLEQYAESNFAYLRIAQFMYSVCEQCCDMVSVGSSPDEWAERKLNNTLHSPTRGNGPSHLYYDICKIYPRLKRFIRPSWNEYENRPEVCTQAQNWMLSNFSKGWAANPDADGIPKYLVFSFGSMARVLGCQYRTVWQDCVRLEHAQGRV